MLIIFHYCVSLIFQILKNRKRLKSSHNAPLNKTLDEVELENDVRFDPPVYRQRYSKVYETLLEEKWRNKFKKLVDFGCAELSLFVFIKNLNIEQMLFVDIDENLLREKIGKIEPLLVDQLRRRSCPLEVSVFVGSVADPDYRLQKTDVVTAIELIEHLYPDTLDAFPYNIFSFIHPKVVIITTPNADFNIMFRSKGFRHPDHKFEWTREQFEDWATNLVERFPEYTVKFFGIGKGPENTEHLGCCSQQALFIRKDLTQDNYISPLYAKSCHCDKNSPCKGQTTECKLQCNCLCALCLPNFSVGICTYLSRSKNTDIDVETVKIENNTKKSYSDSNINYGAELSYNTFGEDDFSKFENYTNPSHSIYYKLVQKIDYPYELDSRSEDERLLQTFQYRIQTFSHTYNRFYVIEKERCEIPVRDLMYGDVDVSIEEVKNLLINANYQIEKCTIEETGSCEDCIISVPYEMDDITSSSEVTESYSSKKSEPNDGTKFESNIETLSDWDDVPYIPEVMQQGTPSSSLESSSNPNKPNPDPLFDSGYLKSPSPLEANQKLPQLTHQENLELAETDHFEDVLCTPSLSSEDNKLHLKKAIAKEKFAGAMSPESPKSKVDPNRVNELDRFHNMSTTKTFMSNILKPQNEFKKNPFKDVPVAGPSSGWKKSRKFKEKKFTENKDHREISPLDDAKSITNCIIQNSLNKIDVGDEIIGRQAELIKDLSPPQEAIPDIIVEEERPEGHVGPLEAFLEVLAPPQAVENGDLANNNRDNEGNNFVPNDAQELDIDEGIDLLNDNLEDLVPLLEDNINVFDNNNDLIEQANNIEVVIPIDEHDIEEIEENLDGNEIESEANDSVAHASREALFDANSEQDLLEDFDIPPQANHDLFDMINLDRSVVLVGMHSVSSSGTRRDEPSSPGAAGSLQTNTNSFPNWLLQILGTQVGEETQAAPPGSHDEPHFYCQGDGLGVHPSVIALEIDEAEDADNDTSTEESSSNNTADFAEVEPGPSDMFDMSSLPEESSLATSLLEDSTGQAIRTVGSVVWSERESSHDNVSLNHGTHDLPTVSSDIESEHVIQGRTLVNGIIRTAVKEVKLRTQNVVSQNKTDNVPGGSGNNKPSQHRCSVSKSVDTLDSEDTETDQRMRLDHPIEVEDSEESGTVEQSEIVSTENGGSSQDVQSSNGSEASEYFESRNQDP